MPAFLDILPDALPPKLREMRDIVFRRQSEVDLSLLPETVYSDARAWAEHTAAEPWIVWRGRRTAERLRTLPLEMLPGESLVGMPHLRRLGAEETAAVNAVRDDYIKTLEAAGVPPWPGGEAGHFHPDYPLLFELGLGGLRERVRSLMEEAPDTEAAELYQACSLSLEGMAEYIKNTAAACRERAGKDVSLEQLAGRCERLAVEPPETFRDALQLMWFTIVALWYGEDHGLTTPGRMDQTLRPFYEADLAAGRMDAPGALDLICELFIHCNRLRGPGSAISVLVGGRDVAGRDVSNDLTWLCLEARRLTHLVYPTVAIAWHEETPAELMDYSCRLLASGIGDPAFFNDELIARGLREHGVTEADSYNYMNSTCVEIKVCGASNIWVTQPYINCPQALLDVMGGIASGELPAPADFHAFTGLVRRRLAEVVGQVAEVQDAAWRRREEFGGFPLASCFISDCLERGRDYDRGGARYNWVENSFVGLANLCDGMTAVKKIVFEAGEMSLQEFFTVLEANYQGHEELLGRIRSRMPRYGRDEAEADAMAAEWAAFLIEITEANTVGLHRYVPGFFCWIQHGVLGERTMATPDGRCSGEPFADGAGAAQGRETAGPTASVLSTTSWCHRAALGGVVHNAKFSGSLLQTERGRKAMRDIIETYLRRGGFEIQINVVDARVLREAQAHPEHYGDLVVRVAGYSDYFVHLSPVMQEEVISRNEHQL